MSEYDRRAADPCWQHKQTMIMMTTLDSHNTSYFFKREDGTYYWLHCRKGKDDVYVDADEMQLDLLGNDPILSTEYIMKAIY